MIPAERGHRSTDISDLTVKKSRTSQDRLLADRRARRRRHAVHSLHAIDNSGGALLHHRAIAICRLSAVSLRAVRHPYALGRRERSMGTILRSGAPFIMAGHLCVIGLSGECGNRCGKRPAQCGTEAEYLHRLIPWQKDGNGHPAGTGSRRASKAQASLPPLRPRGINQGVSVGVVQGRGRCRPISWSWARMSAP